MTSAAVYSLSAFENIGVGSYVLDDTTISNIECLCELLGYTSDTKNTYVNQYNTNVTPAKKPREREVRYKAKPKDDEWKRPAFKATVFAALDNTQSLIGDIRVLFNKINETNCTEKMESIVEKIDEIRDSVDFGDDAELADRMRQVYDAIYKVAVSNKMFSKVYAYVISHINNKYDIHDMFEQKMEEYMKSMENIVDVDANLDYDAYCNFTAVNNTRKNFTALLCEMAKLDGSKINMNNICNTLLQKVTASIDDANKQKEVEEITENLVIIFSHFKEELLESCKPAIKVLASYKTGEKPGLSSRTKFKYVDLAEA
jgi:hypothetical protein